MAQTAGPISSSIIGTGKRICFAAEVDSEVPRQLHRAPTPYPKELRNLARHARNLHHQSIHEQRNAPLSPTSTDRNVTKNYKSNNRPTAESGGAMEHSVSEESSDEANKTVLAKEKSPDIREAKCIRNPTSEYVAKVPTVADYVNSTWKPDEYSKANTAKIVESDKFIEPYRTMSMDATDGKYSDQMRANVTAKSCDVPPVPPPYHIAAAFSKKAALFQQFSSPSETDTRLASPSLPFNPSLSSPDISADAPKQNNLDINVESVKAEEYTPVPDDRANFANSNISNTSADNERIDTYDHLITEKTCTPIPDSGVDPEQNDRTFKPSKIPILKVKHTESSSSDTSSIKTCTSPSAEEFDMNRTLNAYSAIPTSPITGKKYRSPLSAPVKPLDRSRKLTNGIASSNNSCNNTNSLVEATNVAAANRGVVDELNATFSAVAIVKDEINSGRNTPSFSASNKSLGDSSNESKEHASSAPNETLNSETKPKFNWMFGPHKNANVLPVQVKKNPGLGFSIAGGVAGAETGIIVTKVNPDGPAQGTLRPGDKILEVDGIDFTKSDHNNAVAVLRATGAVVSMMISRHQ